MASERVVKEPTAMERSWVAGMQVVLENKVIDIIIVVKEADGEGNSNGGRGN